MEQAQQFGAGKWRAVTWNLQNPSLTEVGLSVQYDLWVAEQRRLYPSLKPPGFVWWYWVVYQRHVEVTQVNRWQRPTWT